MLKISINFIVAIYGIGGAVKRHAAKRSLQRPVDNQILDYEAMLEVCKEMSSTKFSGFSKNVMELVRISLKKDFPGEVLYQAQGVAITLYPCRHLKSHISMYTSEDEFYIDTHDFNLPTIVELSEITPSTFVTCLYDSLWWVGVV